MGLGRSIRILAAGGAVLAPLCAFGHAIEFLTARLTLLPDAVVRLEVTADHAFNPMIPDQAAALEALKSPVEVRVGDGWKLLDGFASPAVEFHTDWTRCAPPNLPPPPAEAVHSLVTASWQWNHPEPELVVRVPKGRMHDVFLWQPPSEQAADGTRWMLLLAGDVTKGIKVNPMSKMPDWVPWAGLWAAVATGLGVWAGLWRRRGAKMAA